MGTSNAFLRSLFVVVKTQAVLFIFASMNNTAHKKGFTLIELIVTMMLAGICSLLAARLFVEAYRQYYAYRERDAAYFAEYRDEVLFKKMLRESPWSCRVDGSFAFTGDNADSLAKAAPGHNLRCETNPKNGRILICFKPETCVPGALKKGAP